MKNGNLNCTLYIVRHGESTANIGRKVAGQTDSALTEKGEGQAKKLQGEFKDINFAAVFSSDLTRARRTAEIISLEKKLAVNTSMLLRERNYGVYENQDYEKYELENKELFEKYNAFTEEEKRKSSIYPSQESEEAMMSRFFTQLREIAVTYPGQKVLVVCHGTIMRTFLVHVGFGKREDFPSGSLMNTAYVITESDGVEFFVKVVVGYKNPEEKV